MNPNQSSTSDRQDRDSLADELIVETGDLEDEEFETVLASNSENGSLTLLEEYKLQKNQSDKKSFIFAMTCAATSLTFAILSYQKI